MTRVVVAVALGAVAGALTGILSGPSHRAVATLSVSKGSSLIAANTVAAFARSKVVADNVRISGRLHAHAVEKTSLVELSYSGSSSVQVVQQAAAALGALAPARFPGVRVQVVDPPHLERAGRPVVRWLLLGASLGLLLAVATLIRLPQRERQVPGTAAAVPGTDVGPPPPPPPPEPEPEPAPEPEPPPDPLAPYRALLAEHGSEFGADQVAEWQAYLDAFAAQIVDGQVPPGLEGMLGDVFEPLSERART